MRLWHGGVPGLRLGDLIVPGHERQTKDGCPICEARTAELAGGPRPVVDGLAMHADKVYLTTDREYARHYASLFGRGDLYRVEPVGQVERSAEDSIETYLADSAAVTGVYDRAVLLTNRQRRALQRRWETADIKVRT
ncbi:MAG: hypothetical protein ACOH10_15365 [Rhodoglobus sp.]